MPAKPVELSIGNHVDQRVWTQLEKEIPQLYMHESPLILGSPRSSLYK